MPLFTAVCVALWALCGYVECHLDCRWHRRQFPRFQWSVSWRDWTAYVAGPVCLVSGIYYRHVNNRR